MAKPICVIPGCGRPHDARGWCVAHYRRWKMYGDPQAHIPIKARNPGALCTIDGCDRPVQARGWCNLHYTRWRLHGDPGSCESRLPVRGDCSVEGCGKPAAAHGFCDLHYRRWRMNGEPGPAEPQRPIPLRDRLLARAVIDLEGPHTTDGAPCWILTGWRDASGYGRISLNKNESLSGHLAAYQLWFGFVPPGLQVDHLCHTEDLGCAGGVTCLHRACVNPAHLEAVTGAENTRRGRRHAKKAA